MNYYINKAGYSDVKSWLITEIDEEKGTAMAVKVEKDCDHVCIPGGFCGHFPNLHQEFANCEPTVVEGAKPFPIVRRKDGVWGYWTDHSVFALETVAIKNLDEVLALPETRLVIGDKGIKYVVWYKLTKKGNISKTFEKLGKLDTECHYFYDYNY